MSKCSDDRGHRDCGRFCNSINSRSSVLCCFAFWFQLISSELQKTVSKFCIRLLKHPRETETNPGSQQSPVGLSNIKTTTAIQLVNSPAFHEGTNKINHSGWVNNGGVIRPRRCTGVWVYKAAPLCWAGRTPPAESGRWIWWRPRQGWRRLGHLLHTVGISRCGRERNKKWTILPMWLILKMTDTLSLLPFYDFKWTLGCSLSVMLIILIINKHQWVHTGSIWKCLIFWWWHKVSTNAFGLLWLTLTRNNLCSKRKQGDIKKQTNRET